MTILLSVIVLLVGPRWALGYLYLAKAPATGCPYACHGDDLVVVGPVVGGTPANPVSTRAAATSDDGIFANYPCLPFPPQFNTWGPPYSKVEGYWSVGNTEYAGNSSSSSGSCVYLVGQIQFLNTTDSRREFINSTTSFACICSAAQSSNDQSGTSSAFSWSYPGRVGNGSWLLSPPVSRVQSTLCSTLSNVGIWNNLSNTCSGASSSNLALAEFPKNGTASNSLFATGTFTDSRYPADLNRLGGLPGFGTWGYQGSLSVNGTYYPDPDPQATAERLQLERQAAANQHRAEAMRLQAAANQRKLTIGLAVGLGVPALILLCAYLLMVTSFIFTWRRRAHERYICDQVHNIILQDPTRPDEQTRLFNILPFYSRMPRTSVFASLSWRTACDVASLYKSSGRMLSRSPRPPVLLPERCRGLEAQAMVYAILKHENRCGATPRSMSEMHKAGRRARRDLAVLLRTILESEEMSAWLHGLEPEPLPAIPKRPTIMQALLLQLPNTRKRLPHSIRKEEAVVRAITYDDLEATKPVPLQLTENTWTTTTSSSLEKVVVASALDEWRIKPGEIEIDQRASGQPWTLGAGAFGVVHRATLNGWETVAVKSLLPNHSGSAQADFLKEITILHESGSENIVRFIGICVCTDKVQLVTEFMDGGDLYHALQDDDRRRTLSWPQRGRRVALDITRGITHLHAQGIVHFDLKSPNILLTKDFTAKVADVGLARFMKGNVFTQVSVIGTLQWAAPEMLRGEMHSVSTKADVYSLGVVIWEIVTGSSPSFGVNWYRPPRVPEECPQAIADLIKACMSVDAGSRPTSTDVYEKLLHCAS